MNLNFSITGGTITQDDGTVITSNAFAGNDSRPGVNPDHIPGRNNPTYCMLHNIGPLPPGVYEFGEWHTHPHLGPHCAALIMINGTGDSYGRDGFFMHGLSSHDPLNSSEGCVCVDHNPRVLIESLRPLTLTVTA